MEETTLVLKLNRKELVRLGVLITNEINRIEESYLFSIKDESKMEQYKTMNNLFDKFAEALNDAKK